MRLMLRSHPILVGKRNWTRGFHRPTKTLFLTFSLQVAVRFMIRHKRGEKWGIRGCLGVRGRSTLLNNALGRSVVRRSVAPPGTPPTRSLTSPSFPPQRSERAQPAVPYKKNFSFKAFHSRSAERTKEPEDRERTDTAPPDQTEVPQTQLQIGDF